MLIRNGPLSYWVGGQSAGLVRCVPMPGAGSMQIPTAIKAHLHQIEIREARELVCLVYLVYLVYLAETHLVEIQIDQTN